MNEPASKNLTPSEILKEKIIAWVKKEYGLENIPIIFQPTLAHFEGDLTLMIFPMLKSIKEKPEVLGNKIGKYLLETVDFLLDFNVIKGFLNLTFLQEFHLNIFYGIYQIKNYGFVIHDKNSKSVIIEYSSPNTNKPLHLGHIRNNLLGYSVAKIIAASGKNVHKTQIINDRGIHICKSMAAYLAFGNDDTPKKNATKGDRFVGNYYIKFDNAYKEEIKNGYDEKTAPIFLKAKELLQKWEAGDMKTIALWKKMNGWVYEGFERTYKALGVDFDSQQYESNTYLLGKEIIAEGLKKEVFYKKDDGSVWVDLKEYGLDEKLLLRSDGTSVYMTQDIGTVVERFKKYHFDSLIYTVGNEQDYHFKVLFATLQKMGCQWAKNLYHLSYGMVDLPSGKMKSREGTVVDADDLIQNMTDTAEKIAGSLGKLEGLGDDEKKDCYRKIGLGALKYYLLKVAPKKRILFDPEKSIDFQGNTGPFVQYTYARIQSILRKVDFDIEQKISGIQPSKKEIELIKILSEYPEIIQESATQKNPAKVANYIYELVKVYNNFYQSTPILGCENKSEKIFRVQLSKTVGEVIKSGFELLGIEILDRM